MIRCMIVEDEILAQDVIRQHVSATSQLELVSVCQNAREAARVLENDEIDLIFLDIQLPGMKGLHFLSSIPDPPLVILTTAYSEYALESYEFNVIDYLLKPISFERFSRAIDKLRNGRLFTRVGRDNEPPDDHFFIKSGTKFYKVNFSEIIYIQSLKDYVKIHTRHHTLLTHQTLTDLEKSLPPEHFLRIHKSYIISLSSIKTIFGNTIEVEQASLPIGNNYRNQVMRLISKGRP